MAELAARRRETQAVTRREVAPLPPRREPMDLQQRAARYAKPVEDGAIKSEPAAPDRQADAPMAPSLPALGNTSPASDVDMMARAADQTRHKRAAGPAQGETIAQLTTRTDTAPQGSLVFALVTRNHGRLAADRLLQWKRVLDRPDARFVQLDLGSTDDSVAVLSDQPGLQLLVLPGGLVTPAATLLQLARHVPGDVLLVADASAEPDPVALALVTAVRSGALAAVAPRLDSTVMAVSAAKLEANADKLLRSWAEFAAVGTGVVRFGAERGPASGRGLVAALQHLPLHEQLWTQAKTALQRLRLNLPL
jgi:hypothetical protein